jgi:hypothetical protein
MSIDLVHIAARRAVKDPRFEWLKRPAPKRAFAHLHFVEVCRLHTAGELRADAEVGGARYQNPVADPDLGDWVSRIEENEKHFDSVFGQTGEYFRWLLGAAPVSWDIVSGELSPARGAELRSRLDAVVDAIDQLKSALDGLNAENRRLSPYLGSIPLTDFDLLVAVAEGAGLANDRLFIDQLAFMRAASMSESMAWNLQTIRPRGLGARLAEAMQASDPHSGQPQQLRLLERLGEDYKAIQLRVAMFMHPRPSPLAPGALLTQSLESVRRRLKDSHAARGVEEFVDIREPGHDGEVRLSAQDQAVLLLLPVSVERDFKDAGDAGQRGKWKLRPALKLVAQILEACGSPPIANMHQVYRRAKEKVGAHKKLS